MSKLVAKSRTLCQWVKITHKDKKETGEIPSGVDLSHLKMGLSALSSGAEIAGFTPLAKSAEIVKVIVEIIEKKAENTEDIKEFAQSTSHLLQVLNGIISKTGSQQMNDDLYQNVEDFRQGLEDTLKTLEKLAECTTFKAFWHAEQDEKVIVGFKEKSDRFIASLNLQVGLEIHHLVSAGGKGRQNVTITYENIKLATPLKPGVFTGRDELVTEGVEKFCSRDQAYLAILGAGGMGKTSLALHIMEHADVREKFQEQRYFVPCEVLPDAPSLIQGLLQILKLPISEGKDGYEILEAYLQSSQKPILLVLDNFETPWYSSKNQKAVQNLIEKVHDQRKVSLIITMRGAEGPGDIKWDKLGGKSGLPPLILGAARKAFLSISPDAKECEELNDLLKKLDCMPLAICLMAQLSKRIALNILIKNWTNSKTNMLKNGNQASQLTSMNTSIDLSLKMVASRDYGSVKILPLLAYLPNGVPFWSLNLPQLSPDFGNDLEMSVINMIDSGLIYEEGKSLQMLSPIREYIQTKHPVTKHHLDQISNFYVHLLQNLPHNQIEAQDLLEQAHLQAVYHFADFPKIYPQIVPMLDQALTQEWNSRQQEHIKIRFLKAQILQWMGYHQKAILEIQKIQATIGQVKLESWKKYLPQNLENVWKTEARTLTKCDQEMGNIYYRQGEYPKAIKKFRDAKVQFNKIGKFWEAANCLRSLGDIHYIRGEYIQGMQIFTSAKSQFEKIGSQLGATQCLQGLGNIHRMEHEYPEAIQKLTDAKSQFEQISNRLGAAQCLRSLGDVHYMQQEYCQATEKLTDARSQFEKIGSQLGVAQCLQGLGNIHLMQNEYPQARENLTDARTLFEEIGDQPGAAHCLQSLGKIHYIQDEYHQAMENLTNAKNLFAKTGLQDETAHCSKILDHIHLKLSMNSASFPGIGTQESLLELERIYSIYSLPRMVHLASCYQPRNGDLEWDWE
ncbi:TPR-like protein [Gymnopus androsaceus JB14]|uniref:TPR-like protein n=1 Tax=Gymnopus androsaceus JB14 TaxID=1447944 RepID=A0A6A4GZL3_9AGAR|nr:TPR-like protein [Gymnopus androsaceus JB14]